MRRRAFDILCVLSLLVALLAAGLWARSVWWASDLFVIQASESRHWAAVSRYGSLILGSGVGRHDLGSGWSSLPRDPTRWLPYLEAEKSYWLLLIPEWMLLFAALLPPAWWCTTRWHRRLKIGHCPACGYDLRGTSGGAACPECGAGAAQGGAAASPE